MAKITYTKLALKQDNSIKTIKINEQDIEVKQYLPLNDKLELISNVINQSVDENNFANPMKIDLYTTLEIIYAYTNISFTEKQQEDVLKLYDAFISSGTFTIIKDTIPEVEYENLIDGIQKSADAIYKHRNSALGILEAVSTDYKDLSVDVDALQASISNPENLTLLKDVVTKLG